jgi:hypothetical protein
MPAVTAIQFTQDQMRTLTGVSAETIRHWRKTIPYLALKTGKAARFSFPDLLGLAVTHELVSVLGVHIATISSGVDALFRLLANGNAMTLNGAAVLVTPVTATLCDAALNGIEPLPTQPTQVISLDPLIAQLQQHMLPVMPSTFQMALPFPSEVVRSRA